MTIDKLINILVTVTLFEMMVTLGMDVSLAELVSVARNWRLASKAALANYVCVPAVTVCLLIFIRPVDPTVLAGILILAVCPGAPFSPACAKLAKGNVPAAVGLMVMLSGSSALAAPLLLWFLLPLVSDSGSLQVNAAKIVLTLLMTQLAPLCLGLGVRRWLPGLANRLQKPASVIGTILNLATMGTILGVYFPLLMKIRLRGYVAMSTLLLASWAAGWLLGGPENGNRKTLAITTSLRNVGVGLVIVAGNLGGTAAVTAVLAYGIFEILGSVLLASVWGRRAEVPQQS